MNIWIAASDNNRAKVEEFIASGLTPNDPDPNGYTCMHAAASYGHRELLDYLVSVGGDVNVKDEEGDTPLHVVEDAKTAKYLVEDLKADWRVKNSDGQTPLQKHDEEEEFPEVVDYLKTLLNDSELGEFAQNRDNDDELPEGFDRSQLQYKLEDIDLNDTDPEQRKRIEEVLNSENPEEGMRKIIQEAVAQQQQQEQEDDDEDREPAKKRRL